MDSKTIEYVTLESTEWQISILGKRIFTIVKKLNFNAEK